GKPPGPRSRARVARDIWWTLQGLGHGPESPGRPGHHLGLSDPGPRRRRPQSTSRAVGHELESPGTAGQTRGPSDPGRSRPGHLVETVVPWARARVMRDSWV
ncbi:hypothetical protein C0215_20085, partial [Clostridioides difficile]